MSIGLLLGGCSASTPVGAASGSAGSGASTTITVFAAASLTEAFATLGEEFEKANPGTRVTFSFGSSSGLATQITQGAPADVFASASARTMDGVVAAKAAAAPQVFAANLMEIAVPPDNPARVTGVTDLARTGIKVALCQADVPCGSAAAKVFANAGVTVKPVTLEADVKATLTKVALGEVDAGVVYVTDVRAAGAKVLGIAIPADVNASTSYPIATMTASANPVLARRFVDFVLSPGGAQVLTDAGFEKPSNP